ncbi:pyridine nucleotide-disulfide oxidoreductase [Bacillaceae bacterium JMAK1]|nr:pyridine nucleotide-disulfide oxidoreductase [Bacillaceae bacterium JMAK1]
MTKDVIVCRCEGTTLEEIATIAAEYQCSAREVKLRTRAGMGYCGGRTCRGFIDYIVSHHSNHQELTLHHRPPVRPIPFALFREVNDE